MACEIRAVPMSGKAGPYQQNNVQKNGRRQQTGVQKQGSIVFRKGGMAGESGTAALCRRIHGSLGIMRHPILRPFSGQTAL